MQFRALYRRLAPVLVVGLVALSFSDAAARAGRGRSFGSRGTNSYQAPSRPAPSYDSNRSQQSSPSGSGSTQPLSQGQTGGLFRGLGGGLLGGLAGGMLGGLLFRSLGIAGPGAGGGMGLFELALLAGGGYLIYRFVASRRRPAGAPVGSPFFGRTSDLGEAGVSRSGSPEPGAWDRFSGTTGNPVVTGLSQIQRTDPAFDEARFRDTAQDVFFRVQGAWTRRDLASVDSLLGDEVRRTLQDDVDELKRRGQINRLENIAVRETEIVEAWQDQGQDFLTLRVLASLLDYTTDESGTVQSGSDRDPVKFEEYWTFGRTKGAGAWRLTSIQQA